VGNQFGVFGGGKAKSTNPGDVITGSLMKQGYIRVAEVEESMKEKTFIVSYGETGRREVDLGYTIEVTIQFTSAKTHEMICTVSGEGLVIRKPMMFMMLSLGAWMLFLV
jgi:hypothetical protein